MRNMRAVRTETRLVSKQLDEKIKGTGEMVPATVQFSWGTVRTTRKRRGGRRVDSDRILHVHTVSNGDWLGST